MPDRPSTAHVRRLPWPLAALAAAAGATAVVVLSIGGGAVGAAEAGVAVVDNDYDPATVRITVGDTVRWRHEGTSSHSVTADDGSFDSNPGCSFPGLTGCMRPGDEFTHTFDQPGSYPYYCRLHGGPGGSGMSGVIEVAAAPAPPPPTATPTTQPPTTRPPRNQPPSGSATTTTVATATTAPPTTSLGGSTTTEPDFGLSATGGDNGPGSQDPSPGDESAAAPRLTGVDGVAWLAGFLVLAMAVWFTVGSWLLARRSPS